MKYEHCCDGMKRLVEDQESPLIYKPVWRSYSLVSVPLAYREGNEVCIGFDIAYCPRCATVLPKDLAEEWSDIVEEQFGITGSLDERIKDLPQEFKTDEWWKKRGL